MNTPPPPGLQPRCRRLSSGCEGVHCPHQLPSALLGCPFRGTSAPLAWSLEPRRVWWGRRSAWIGLLACWCSGPDCPHSLLRHPKVWGLCVCPLSHPLKASPLLIAKETCMIGVTQECLPPPQNNPGQRAGTLTAGRPSSSPDSCSPSKPSQLSCTVCAPVGQAPWAPTGPCTLGGLCEGGPGRCGECVPRATVLGSSRLPV